MEVIGFILAAVVVGLVLFIRRRVRAGSGSGSGRGAANPTRPDKS